MRRLYLFATFLVLYEFTTYSANDMIMPGMLKVVNQFDAPLSYVALSLSLYMLGECSIQLWLGPLAERFGKRRLIVLGSFSFMLFTLFIALSSNIHQFMLGRWLQGSGMAFIAMGYALIHEKFNDQQAVKLIALMGNVSILAPLIGPVIGGVIVSYSNWHYIFALSGLLGLIAWSGLYRFTPEGQRSSAPLKLAKIIRHYRTIAHNPIYHLGVWATIINTLPLLIWIGLAPNLVLYHLKLSYSQFISYQIISIGGLAIASILLQFLAGRWKFAQLIQRGSIISLLGVSISLLLHNYITWLAVGMLIYGIGVGLSNGSIIRIIMSNKHVSQSMAASLMTFSQTLLFACGLQLCDWLCSLTNYSAFSFSLCCFCCGTLAWLTLSKFARLVANRSWE